MDRELEEDLELEFDALHEPADGEGELDHDELDEDAELDDMEPDDEDLDLETIHRDNFAFVWRTMRNLGVPQAALDDAVQDVFLTVHRRMEDFEGRSALRTWLFGIARRVAYRYRRSAARRQRKLDALAGVERTQTSLDTVVAEGEALDILAGFLESLDDAKREVFVLHTLEGVTGGEIADSLGISVNTVHSRLRLARRSFERMCKTLQVREERALASARRANEPAPDARRRAWALLVPMIELPREGLAAGGAWSLATQVKVFAATVALGTASLGAVKLTSDAPVRTPDVLVSTAAAATPAPTRAPAREASPDVAPTEPTPASDEAPVQRPRREHARTEPAPASPEPAPSLARETRAMSQLRAAFHGGDTSKATALLDRLDRDFPEGAFGLERAGYRVMVGCAAEPSSRATEAAATFVDAHPSASIAGQVRASCLD